MRLTVAKKYYVDSENVGDFWIDLFLEESEAESEFLVFYTNNSPRIDYEHAIALKNSQKSPTFIKCYEGNNGLDFQLVSLLGYNLRDGSSDELIIVSKDTGYDAVIAFWKDHDKNIIRLSPNNVQISDSGVKIKPVVADVEAELHQSEEKIFGVDRREIYTIVNCLKGNKNLINSACVRLYGSEKGGKIYKYLKEHSFDAPEVAWKADTKIKKICNLIFKYCNDSCMDIPDSLNTFIYENLTAKGKKTVANKTIKKYGDIDGVKLNKMLKPFYSIFVEVRK